MAKAISQDEMPRAVQQIEQLMRIRRGVRADKENDFEISTQDTFTDLWNQISYGIFAVMRRSTALMRARSSRGLNGFVT